MTVRARSTPGGPFVLRVALALLLLGPALAAAAPGAVTIGLPPPSARGVYATTYTDLATGETVTGESPFAGEADVATFDAGGRAVRADLWVEPGGTASAFAGGALIPQLAPLGTGVDHEMVFRGWFLPGAARPFAYTHRSGVSATASAQAVLPQSEASGHEVVAYGDAPAMCRFQNALQGRTVADGDAVPADLFCPFARSDDATPLAATVAGGLLRLDGPFHTRSTTTVNGASTVTTYDGNWTAWLAEGFPFPVAVHVEAPCTAACEDGDAGFRSSMRLARYEAGTVPPRARDAAPPAPSPSPTSPVTRWGPADGAHLPWPLSAAHATASSHPFLPGLAGYLARHPDAVLARAEYRGPEEAAGAETWTLLYADPSGVGHRVLLERAAGAPPMAPVRAEERATDVPGIGPTDLPATMPTLADALAAWREAYAATEGAPTSLVWSASGDEDLAPAGGAFVGAGRLVDRDGTLRARSAVAREHFLALGADGLRAGLFQASVKTGFVSDLPVFAVVPSDDVPTEAEQLRAMSVAAWAGVALAGGGGLLLLLLLLLEPLRLALARAVAVPLFSRLERGEVLDNEARRRVLDVVRAEPGVNASELLARAAVSGGVGGYHLGVLEREGYLTAVETAGFRRYYVTGSMDVRAMRRDAALRAGSSARVHAIIQAEPGIRLTDLAARADLSIAAASKTVRALEKAGLVTKERRGREVSLRSS